MRWILIVVLALLATACSDDDKLKEHWARNVGFGQMCGVNIYSGSEGNQAVFSCVRASGGMVPAPGDVSYKLGWKADGKTISFTQNGEVAVVCDYARGKGNLTLSGPRCGQLAGMYKPLDTFMPQR